MTDHVHTIVIGAGIVGLAIARKLAQQCGDVLVLERADAIGTETSARNSEVIHAGMYYAAGTLKAAACVEGRRMLYEHCRERGVAHRRIGKLIVATSAAQVDGLRAIARRAEANGLTTPDDTLQWLDAAAVRDMEPALDVTAALWSPATGIVDTHALMLSYLADAEAAGAVLSLNTGFVAARRVGGEGGHWRVETQGAEGDYGLACTHLVNAAGLHAQRVASAIDGLAASHIPEALWLKGNYFSVVGARPPFSHLIYPMPAGGGLGVHLTMDLAGQARFGPDTETVSPPFDTPDYRVDPHRADAFYDTIRDYWPGLPDGSLVPAYSGMRPKIRAATQPGNGHALDANDFVISGPSRHGLAGLVNLFGIESPGVTASLSLAERVAALLPAD